MGEPSRKEDGGRLRCDSSEFFLTTEGMEDGRWDDRGGRDRILEDSSGGETSPMDRKDCDTLIDLVGPEYGKEINNVTHYKMNGTEINEHHHDNKRGCSSSCPTDSRCGRGGVGHREGGREEGKTKNEEEQSLISEDRVRINAKSTLLPWLPGLRRPIGSYLWRNFTTKELSGALGDLGTFVCF